MATDQESVDERNFINNLSEPITPVTPQKPFHAKYKINVSNPEKDGESLTYKIKTLVLSDSEERQEFIVLRVYEELQSFHISLSTNPDIAGLIMPPLPVRPNLNARAAEQSSKKQLGSKSKVLLGDCFTKDCRALQRYLSLLSAHWWFGSSKHFHEFLTVQKSTSNHVTKSGIFTKIASVMESSRRSNRKDIDEVFHGEREKTMKYSNMIQSTEAAFQEVLNAQLRVSASYKHLCTVLIMGGEFLDENSVHSNRLLVKFSDTLDDAKHGNDVDLMNNENTLGFHLALTHRYTESVKDMHQQRISLLIDYEEANRILEKAKPHRRQAAEDMKLEIQRQCENSTERARREIVRYKEKHVLAMQEALTLYAEAKVKTARGTYALLAKSLLSFKQITV